MEWVLAKLGAVLTRPPNYKSAVVSLGPVIHFSPTVDCHQLPQGKYEKWAHVYMCNRFCVYTDLMLEYQVLVMGLNFEENFFS